MYLSVQCYYNQKVMYLQPSHPYFPSPNNHLWFKLNNKLPANRSVYICISHISVPRHHHWLRTYKMLPYLNAYTPREHAVRCSVNARYLLFKFSKVIKHDDKRIHFNINFIHWKCLFNSNKNTICAHSAVISHVALRATTTMRITHHIVRWCLAGEYME